MSPTSRRYVAAGAAASALLLGALAGCGAGAAPRPAAPAPGIGTALDGPVSRSISSLPLLDANGHRTSLGAYAGKTLVVSDSMTLCTEDCPLDTANIVSAARATNAAGLGKVVEFLTITVDPRRDTPGRLRAYRQFYDPAHALPDWALLTGSPKDVARLWKYLGVYWHRTPEGTPPDRDWLTNRPLTYDVAHADEVIVFDGRGHERFVISGHAHVPSTGAVPSRMRTFLNAEGRRHLHRPGATAWTPAGVLSAVSWLSGKQVTPS